MSHFGKIPKKSSTCLGFGRKTEWFCRSCWPFRHIGFILRRNLLVARGHWFPEAPRSFKNFWVAKALMSSNICKILSWVFKPASNKDYSNTSGSNFLLGLSIFRTNVFATPSKTVSLMLMRQILKTRDSPIYLGRLSVGKVTKMWCNM